MKKIEGQDLSALFALLNLSCLIQISKLSSTTFTQRKQHMMHQGFSYRRSYMQIRVDGGTIDKAKLSHAYGTAGRWCPMALLTTIVESKAALILELGLVRIFHDFRTLVLRTIILMLE
mmetsp:Transcript_18542/g.53460  ORF Transcript_18542/g.53460 Transcript_18542/m.53460 type:complete len:118 (-) Transcript_18542:432-785(-)